MYPFLKKKIDYLHPHHFQYLILYAVTCIRIFSYTRIMCICRTCICATITISTFICNFAAFFTQSTSLHFSSTTTIHQLLFILRVYLRTLSAQSGFKSCAQGLSVCFNAFHASHTMTRLQNLFNCGCRKSGKQLVVSI